MSRDAVVAALRAHQPRLYAVLDPARDPELLGWLREAGIAYQCLFQGEKAKTLAEEAPYLAHLGEGPEALTSLVEASHGGAAVTYLVSNAPFYAIRRHLRRIQFVRSDEDEVLFFRFYDPRIARVFLPTCDDKQIDWMFGEVVERWLAEDIEAQGLLDLHVAEADGGRAVQVQPVAG